jgi:Rv0078B-related antitoxin
MMLDHEAEAEEVYYQTLRRMTPVQRLKIGMSMYHFARKLKLAGLRRQHPEATEEELKKMLNEIFLYASD